MAARSVRVVSRNASVMGDSRASDVCERKAEADAEAARTWAEEQKRAERLGFRPQKELLYNRLLPYADRLDEESALLLANIRENFGKSVVLRELKPGAAIWTARLIKYCHCTLLIDESSRCPIVAVVQIIVRRCGILPASRKLRGIRFSEVGSVATLSVVALSAIIIVIVRRRQGRSRGFRGPAIAFRGPAITFRVAGKSVLNDLNLRSMQ